VACLSCGVSLPELVIRDVPTCFAFGLSPSYTNKCRAGATQTNRIVSGEKAMAKTLFSSDHGKNHPTPMIHNVPAGGPKVVMGVTLQPIKVMVKSHGMVMPGMHF